MRKDEKGGEALAAGQAEDVRVSAGLLVKLAQSREPDNDPLRMEHGTNIRKQGRR